MKDNTALAPEKPADTGPATAEEPKKRGRPRKADAAPAPEQAPTATAPAVQVEPSAATPATAPPAAAPATLSEDSTLLTEIRKAGNAAAGKVGGPPVAEVLGKFGIRKYPEIAADKAPELLAALQALVA